ncbi:MAG TPA: phosphatidylinositol-specific phospholipase C [Pseudonocardiaceae bacterium]
MTELSIPGTHNSGCNDGLLGFGKTQNLSLPEQLRAGIRFFDIRLAHYEDDLFVHHDVMYMGKTYADVLDIFSTFLTAHPSETILMSVDEEGRFDSPLRKFAPSEFVGKLARGDIASWEENEHSFENTFKARTWDHIADAPLFYNFTAPPPGTTAATASPAFTPSTTLGDVRGTIILLRRFEGSQDIGLDLSYWPENACFRSTGPPIYDVEDRYMDPGDDSKFDMVVAHIEKARKDSARDLYFTFSSAADLQAGGYAETINPRLNDYLAACPPGRVGIIATDYFEEPGELVTNVIRTNRRPDRPMTTTEEAVALADTEKADTEKATRASRESGSRRMANSP